MWYQSYAIFFRLLFVLTGRLARVQFVLQILMTDGPATAKQLLTNVELERGLGSIEPSGGWLKHGSVEVLLGWHVGAIQQFLKSVEPEQRGSTRRRTTLSGAEAELAKVGMFFTESYVAVTGLGGKKPFWGALRYTEIREPVARGQGDELQVVRSKGVSSAGSSNGDLGPGSPESEAGEPDGGGATDGELGRGPSRCDAGVEVGATGVCSRMPTA